MPIKLAIKRKVIVVTEEHIFYSPAKIQLQNFNQVDSVYKALLDGRDFGLLVQEYSIRST